MTLEFGTQSGLRVLQALRADHWLQRQMDAPATLARQIRRQMREAFYVDTPAWQAQLVPQTLDALEAAAAGLAA